MKALSLFTGIGGLDLAAQMAGIRPIAFCEIDPFCQKVLKKHWPHIPIHKDICKLRGDGLEAVSIIYGGSPCQDLSVAGKQRGLEGERSGLWFEMLRIIEELHPKWVVEENVAGLLTANKGKEIRTMLSGLEYAGYEAISVLSSASNYGAAFEGKRIFIIATATSFRHRRFSGKKLSTFVRELVSFKQEGSSLWGKTERCLIQSIRTQKALPDYLRSNYGFPDWVDRIKSLGNAVVPQQAYPIFKAIVETERIIGEVS